MTHLPPPSIDHLASCKDDTALVGLLERQHELLSRLDALSRRQGACIDADDDNGLLAVVGQRQEVVDLLTRLSLELAPYRTRWEAHLAAMAPDGREQVRRRVGVLSALAGAIAARDAVDRARLASRRDRLAEELTGLGMGREAMTAYRQRPAAGPSFQDREA
jgi:hypothetical protein